MAGALPTTPGAATASAPDRDPAAVATLGPPTASGPDRDPALTLDLEARQVMARVARTFDLATRFLPGDVRRDVRRLYLVLRILDDLVDEGAPDADARLAAVEAWAAGGLAVGREAQILDELSLRYPGLPRDAVLDFCAGMRTDLAGPRFADEAELATYCYRVAGTVGRLMVPILGALPGREPEADRAARALGAAMQRTNIVRDLVEDAVRGRVYVPATDLRACGLDADLGPALLEDLAGWPAQRRDAIIRLQAGRAEVDYAVGLAGIGALRRGGRAVRLAAILYREILRQVERDTRRAAERRIVVPRLRKAYLLARASMAFAETARPQS